jgi:hypothetical protein
MLAGKSVILRLRVRAQSGDGWSDASTGAYALAGVGLSRINGYERQIFFLNSSIDLKKLCVFRNFLTASIPFSR